MFIPDIVLRLDEELTVWASLWPEELYEIWMLTDPLSTLTIEKSSSDLLSPFAKFSINCYDFDSSMNVS